jgi:type IV secretory pathway VirB9-like protein
MPIALGPGVPARSIWARMYCISRSLTVSQSSFSSFAMSRIEACRQRRPTYKAKRLVKRGLSARKSSRSRSGTAAHDAADPHVRVDQANGEARVQSTRAGYINAIQVYSYSDGALYQVYAAPGEITDIALEPDEQLVGSGPVAAGDTVRWIIGDTQSGAGPATRIHILLKPTRPDLVTNLIIDTDRRT